MKDKKDTIESRIRTLQAIVEKVESDATDLETSIEAFKEGAAIAKSLKKDLTTFEDALDKMYNDLSKEIFDNE